MLVPRYWAKTDGSATSPTGKRYRLQLWGWSDASVGEALVAARRRLTEVASRIARGELGGPYAYGSRPLREELVRTLGELNTPASALITRNRYGALVLNTAHVPFIDIDIPATGPLTALVGLLTRRRSGDSDAALDRIRAACRRQSRDSFRIYRTKAGYRVLATNQFLDPCGPATKTLLAGFSADPQFVRLCGIQASFRARLTPKPWRIGCPLPPNQYPRNTGDDQQRYADWLRRYEAASVEFASCQYLESVGSEWPSADAREIVDEHDRIARALSKLPLA